MQQKRQLKRRMQNKCVSLELWYQSWDSLVLFSYVADLGDCFQHHESALLLPLLCMRSISQ